MTTLPDLNAKQLAEAKDILERRGNNTDKMLFNSLTNHVRRRDEVISSVGVSHKRRKTDIIADRFLADELALILSHSLGMTQHFWWGAALTAAGGNKEAA